MPDTTAPSTGEKVGVATEEETVPSIKISDTAQPLLEDAPRQAIIKLLVPVGEIDKAELATRSVEPGL